MCRSETLASDVVNVPTTLAARIRVLGSGKSSKTDPNDSLSVAVTPTTPAEQVRFDLAGDLLDDIRRLDTQLKESHKRIRTAVAASGTTLTDVFGIGPIIAAMLIGHTGDIGRFTNRDRFAAYNGTAPVEFSSGGRTVHRVSQRGNRQLNHALHMAAICQLRQPHCDGRSYFERRVAEGKTKKEAIRALKRQISNTVYGTWSPTPPRLDADQEAREDNRDTTRSQRDRSHIPATGSSARSLPDPPPR